MLYNDQELNDVGLNPGFTTYQLCLLVQIAQGLFKFPFPYL